MNANEFTQMVRPVALSNRTYSKVFGIGANKTGTTSLEAIFRLYGFNVPHQHHQEMLITWQTYRGNYGPFRKFVEQYDFFQDQPFAAGPTYIVADALFPGSKFILTERDPDAWFASVCRYIGKLHDFDDVGRITEDDLRKFPHIFPGYAYENTKRALTEFEDGKPVVRWDKLFDRDYFIAKYLRRNEDIRHYFLGRESDLLVIDLSSEKTTERICRFLGIPPQFAATVPHLNRST